MKQNITEKQWNEISGEHQRKIMNFLEDVGNEQYIGTGSCHECGNNFYLNIGQMIEFLGDDFNSINKQFPEPLNETIIVFIQSKNREENFKARNVCDALWKSVKYKLGIDINLIN